MKKVYLFIIILVISACSSAAASPTPIPTIIVDGDSAPSNNNTGGGDITASAVVVPLTEANLSFASIGHVSEVKVGEGDRVFAGDVLVSLDTSLLEARVREAQANLDAAQAQLRYLIRIGTNQPHLETAEADVDRAQALLDLANANLESQSILTAPFGGTIIEVNTGPYETVMPGQVVVVMADLSKFQVETTDLSERDVTRVQNGQSAGIFLDALNAEFTGRVVDIDRIGSTLGGDVVYTVTIAFDKQPQGLRWGMSADVNITTGE